MTDLRATSCPKPLTVGILYRGFPSLLEISDERRERHIPRQIKFKSQPLASQRVWAFRVSSTTSYPRLADGADEVKRLQLEGSACVSSPDLVTFHDTAWGQRVTDVHRSCWSGPAIESVSHVWRVGDGRQTYRISGCIALRTESWRKVKETEVRTIYFIFKVIHMAQNEWCVPASCYLI